jgi:hypothetical protein
MIKSMAYDVDRICVRALSTLEAVHTEQVFKITAILRNNYKVNAHMSALATVNVQNTNRPDLLLS